MPISYAQRMILIECYISQVLPIFPLPSIKTTYLPHRYIYLRENNYHYRVDFRSISLYINIFISYPYYLQ